MITLTLEEAQVILNVLGEVPGKISYTAIRILQDKAAGIPKEPATKPAEPQP